MLTNNTQTPAKHTRLAMETVLDFVSPFIKNRAVYRDMVSAFGSPLYVLETDVLSKKAARFRAAFHGKLPQTSFYYAMKSNNLPCVSRHLLQSGFGLDVSSGLELEAALEMGARSVMFSGPGKTYRELELAANHPDRVVILLDSGGEARRLAQVLEKKSQRMSVGIRLNNNPDGLWRKFGVLPEDLPEVYRDIRRMGKLVFKGLQFHSSWNLNPDRQAAFIETLGQTLKSMPDDFLRAIKFIDIGGGYWPPQGEWLLSGVPGEYLTEPGVPIEVFAETLSEALKTHIFPLTECRICFEPGRWICNDAMHILIRVVDRKASDLVITDAGTNTVGWERFETDYCPVLNLSRPDNSEQQCHILGSLCTPHDVWGYTYFGTDIRERDILMIPAQGAYTYSLRQQFIKPLPRVVVKEDDTRFFLLPNPGGLTCYRTRGKEK